ncbi:hypothetical protein J2X31_002368, partial [Flavobacterium arsenatis]|nr:hypothetical protein [Flavobacterium arsenatis]
MKNKYLIIVCLFLVSSFGLFAQQAPIAEVVIPEPEVVCMPGDCVTLSAEYFKIKPTNTYTVEPIIPQNLFSFTGGTVLDVTGDDTWSPIFNLPFKFCFYGETYDKVLVGPNGLITFTTNGSYPNGSPGGGTGYVLGTPIPNTGPNPPKNAIYGVGQDTDLRIFGNGGGQITNPLIQNVNYYVGGVEPNRFFVANFNRLPLYDINSCPGSLGATVNEDVNLQTSQIVIYETTNIIDVQVRKRTACTNFNGGHGVIGIQNATGTAAVTPPGRNMGSWSASNEAWRFIPASADPNPPLVTLEWFNGAGTLIGTGDSVQVCPTGNETFTVEATYFRCGSTEKVVVDDEYEVIIAPDLPVLDPLDLALCTSDPAPYVFPTINQDTYILDGASEFDYEIYYFRQENMAAAYNKQTSQALSTAQQTNFSVPNSDPYTIYVLIIDTMGSDCHNVRPFTLQGGNPSGDFSYPDDGGDPGYCISGVSVTPILNDLTAGGVYTIAPTTGLTIDPDTGVLDLAGSTPGTYTVTYTIPEVPGSCPEWSAPPVTVLIEGCVSTTPVAPGPVCQGTPTFNLATSDAGAGATYTWKDSSGTVISNVQNPTGVPVPSGFGDFPYTVFATNNGVDSAVESVILTVHPTPIAEFVGTATTICSNNFTYLTLTGTPGATVEINDGSGNSNVILDATGNGQYTTGVLTAETTYTIINATSNTIPVCSNAIASGTPNSVAVVSVGLPTATMVGFTNPIICSGTAGSFTIQGTPEATVTYTVNGGNPQDVLLPTSGQLLVNTPIQNASPTTVYTYELTNIVSGGTDPCPNDISGTGETATLTVNALPTATFSTTTPTVCQNTPATIQFTGTPNAIVTYNYGTGDLSVTLDASGSYVLTTDNLPDPQQSYTFTLVSVEETS